MRALFLFLATRAVDLDTGEPLSQPLQAGFQGSAPIWSRTARNEYEELENRVLCRKEHRRVVRKKLTELMLSADSERRQRILEGLVIPPDALHLLDRPEDRPAFNRQRRGWLIEQEAAFYAQWGIEPAPPGEVDDGDDVESDTEPEVVEQID